jgi:hypothetical protein
MRPKKKPVYEFGDKVHSGETDLVIVELGQAGHYIAYSRAGKMWYRDDYELGWNKLAKKRDRGKTS